MRKKLALFILFSIVHCNAQWIDISPDINLAINDIANPAPDTIIAIAEGDIILKSTDGGITWDQKEAGVNVGLKRIKFANPNIGYALSSFNLFKTVDGGETWFELDIPNQSNHDIFLLDENRIYILGFTKLVQSTDGGLSWEVLNQSPPYHTKVQFFEDGIGFIGNYGIYKTADNGASWTQVFQSPNYEEYEGSPFSFINPNTGFTYWHGLYKFTDEGNIWLGANVEIPELLDFVSIDETTSWGIIKGFSMYGPPSRGIVKITVDGESTTSYSDEVFWHPEDAVLYTMRFFDNVGFVVGFYLENNSKALIWKNETNENYMKIKENDISFSFKVYPVPASSEINIEFQNANPQPYSVTISDLSGNQLFYKEYKAQNKITVNVNHLPKGVYWLSVLNPQESYKKKILIK